MKIRFWNCAFCLIFLLVVNNFSQNLAELQISSWDLGYQIKLQNQRTPQFVDLIRKKNASVKPITKTEVSETEIYQQNVAVGEGRIRASKALTKFQYNPKLSFKQYLLLRADSPELKKVIEQYADVCLKLFRKQLKTEKLAQNDIADASALAFILAYEVYFGEKLSAEYIKWKRGKGREVLLNSA